VFISSIIDEMYTMDTTVINIDININMKGAVLLTEIIIMCILKKSLFFIQIIIRISLGLHFIYFLGDFVYITGLSSTLF